MGPAVASSVERDTTLKCTNTVGKSNFGALERVLCRKAISVVPFICSVLNEGSNVFQEVHNTCYNRHKYE